MNMNKFYLNKDGKTVDIYQDGTVVTIELSMLTDIMAEIINQPTHTFIEGVGVMEVPTLSKQEQSILDEQAQHDRDVIAEGEQVQKDAMKMIKDLFN